jgi:hypothetical protein
VNTGYGEEPHKLTDALAYAVAEFVPSSIGESERVLKLDSFFVEFG